MNEEEVMKKIQEVQQEFLDEVRKIEQIRNEKIKMIHKGIDQKRIDQILADLKSSS
jgi:response regulator of citrate/malate metabolism